MALTDKKITLSKKDKAVKQQKKINKSKLPTKNTINLIGIGKKKLNPVVVFIIVVVALAAIAVFTKFAIVDRFQEVKRAQAEVAD
ncbi:MAG: hypothetical protein IKQ18_04750, partial [Clostridia bacterium]|nr:hypothetical protein [Clostridia bacterium]